MTFHLGTLAFGAFIIALVSIVRSGLEIIAQHSKSHGNRVMACIASCLGCCVGCFESTLRFLNKNAYIDVAVHSTNFCTAAKNSFEFVVNAGVAVAALNGACSVIQVVGSLLVAVSGGLTTYLLVTGFSRYTSDLSPHYVADPSAVAIMAGVLCLGIGIVFMHTFDQCADTMLYTFTDNKKNTPQTLDQFAPDNLSKLVSEASSGNYHALQPSGAGTAVQDKQTASGLYHSS